MSEKTFHVGDSDLFLLGFAAIVAARFQYRRKSGRVRGIEGFPQSDEDALARLVEGVASGAYVPLDDVREIYVSIHGEDEAMQWLLSVARPKESEEGADG